MTFFLDVQWLVLLGDASYSLYLIHSLLISRTLDLLATLPHTARVAACFAAAIATSLWSCRLIEESALRLLRPKQTAATTTPGQQSGTAATAFRY
jgi:peptidoglycan/LPS O-acetylase OafA/YrhL